VTVDLVAVSDPRRDCPACSGLGWRMGNLTGMAATVVAVGMTRVSLLGDIAQLDRPAARFGTHPVCRLCGGSGLDVQLGALAGWLDFIHTNHAFALEQVPGLALVFPDAAQVLVGKHLVELLEDNLGALPALLDSMEVRRVHEAFAAARRAMLSKLAEMGGGAP
jgi:hypothetical protein